MLQVVASGMDSAGRLCSRCTARQQVRFTGSFIGRRGALKQERQRVRFTLRRFCIFCDIGLAAFDRLSETAC